MSLIHDYEWMKKKLMITLDLKIQITVITIYK